MTTERFNELLKGALHHPFPMFTLSRMTLALKYVVDETGKHGEKALEDWCRQRDERDEANSTDDYLSQP